MSSSSSPALSPASSSSSPSRLSMALPSPPAFKHRSSRQRLHLPAHPHDPPVPPRLVGSELLRKVTHLEHHHSHSEAWLDRDEFGTRRASSQSPMSSPASTTPALSPDTPPTSFRSPRRAVSLPQRARSHSPPPTPHFHDSALMSYPFPDQMSHGMISTHVLHESSVPELDLSSSWSWPPSPNSTWARTDAKGVLCKA